MGVPLWLVVSTVSVYLAFFIGYGEEVFDPDFQLGSCTDILDCIGDFFSDAIEVFEVFAQFITLGGFSSPLPDFIQPALILFFAIAWAGAILL